MTPHLMCRHCQRKGVMYLSLEDEVSRGLAGDLEAAEEDLRFWHGSTQLATIDGSQLTRAATDTN